MDGWLALTILENIVFWILVFYIAWNEKASPEWSFVLLFVFILYFGIRAIFQRQGMERAVWIYTLNMIIILYLMRTFFRT
jgi:hypothetical protein